MTGTNLDITELILLEELIAADNFGRVWDGTRSVIVYDSAANAYTPTELAELLGIKETQLDAFLAEHHWIEHDIAQILAGTITVKFRGEGVLLSSDDLGTCERPLCRLFTPPTYWKPGACAEVAALEALLVL